MFDKFFVGGDVISSVNNGKFKPISRVTLLLDDSNAITAGDDTGREIVANCPHATQTMVDSLLDSLKGYEYQAYEASSANIDPSAELGDGVTVGGIYSVIAKMRDDGSGYASLSAPGEAELEDEYPMDGPMTQMFNREIKKVGARITKTAEEIRAEISGLVDGEYVSASITAALGEVKLEASSEGGTTTITLNGAGTEIKTQTLDITVKAANINGKLTASQIETDDLKVKAANITGTLVIGQLPEGLASTDDIPTKLNDLDGAADDITTIVKGTVTTTYLNAKKITAASVSADGITAGTLDASFLSLDGLLELKNDDARGYVGANNEKGGAVLSSEDMNVFVIANDSAAKLSYWEEHKIWVHSGGCYSSETIQVFSDRTMKDNINYDLSEEESLFSTLLPCSFSYISDKSAKKHWGFIAQDFIGSAEGLGMDTDKLAVIGEYEGKYSIGYGEITALNTHMIQRIMRRVAALESRLEE